MNPKIFAGMLLLSAGLLVGWYMLGTGVSPDQAIKNTFQMKQSTISPTKTPKSIESAAGNGTPMEKGGQAARIVVTYTDTGFAPSPLVIVKGESVVFVNESSKQMQVASAMYPTHQILPSFVQKSSVGKGGVYEYTFTSVGTWKYQNDAFQSDIGSVVVQ